MKKVLFIFTAFFVTCTIFAANPAGDIVKSLSEYYPKNYYELSPKEKEKANELAFELWHSDMEKAQKQIEYELGYAD